MQSADKLASIADLLLAARRLAEGSDSEFLGYLINMALHETAEQLSAHVGQSEFIDVMARVKRTLAPTVRH